MVRVDRDIGIGEKKLEPDASFAHVVQRLDKWVRRRKSLALELQIDPLEEQFHEGFAVGQPMQLLGLAAEFAIADLLLYGIKSLDLFQGLGGACGFGGQSLEEASPALTTGLIESAWQTKSAEREAWNGKHTSSCCP